VASPPPFANEPVLELRRAPVRAQLADALGAVDARLPLRVPVWVGTDRGAVEGLDSTDPGKPERVVATAGRGDASDVRAAVDDATRGAREWGARPAAERAATLVAAARLLRERRVELAALEVRECAKPWPDVV
jgi:RHH-type proline utilization regulon transcriptional repressor/proline dehydrogenase/delta 1-pyrroline-5-carboxylate dehydrogenase